MLNGGEKVLKRSKKKKKKKKKKKMLRGKWHLRAIVGNFGCGIFVDFEKVFDTIDYNILIQNWITIA